MRDSRMASRSSCIANLGTASGSSWTTCRRVSAAAWIDGGGGLQLVGRVRDEVAPDGVELPLLGDVADDDQGGAVGSRRDRAAEPPCRHAGLDEDRGRLATFPAVLDRAPQGERLDGVERGRGRGEVPADRVVRERDPSIGPDQEETFPHRGERQVPDPAVLEGIELLLPADRLGGEGPLLPPPRRSRRAMPAEERDGGGGHCHQQHHDRSPLHDRSVGGRSRASCAVPERFTCCPSVGCGREHLDPERGSRWVHLPFTCVPRGRHPGSLAFARQPDHRGGAAW